jgi:hypothetical protein
MVVSGCKLIRLCSSGIITDIIARDVIVIRLDLHLSSIPVSTLVTTAAAYLGNNRMTSQFLYKTLVTTALLGEDPQKS